MKKIVLILSSLFLYGCGTLTTLKDPCPYIGTRYDYNMVAGNFYDGVGFKHMTRPLPHCYQSIFLVIIYRMMKQENHVGNTVTPIINILG